MRTNNINIRCYTQTNPEVTFTELTWPPLPRPEKTVVSPFCAGTRRRGRVLESFNSARSSGLPRDRRAGQTTQTTAAKEAGEPRGTTTTTHQERPQVVSPGQPLGRGQDISAHLSCCWSRTARKTTTRGRTRWGWDWRGRRLQRSHLRFETCPHKLGRTRAKCPLYVPRNRMVSCLPGTKSSCNWGLRRQWWGGGKGDEDASRGFDVFEVDDVMSAGGGALQTQYKV